LLILRTRQKYDLRRIQDDAVQAVIFLPPSPPAWLGELAAAVKDGALSIERTVLPDCSRDQVEAWLSEFLPDGNLAPWLRDTLIDDILGLTDVVAATAAVSRFRVRIFTEAPTSNCGFHIDTVVPGAPPWGVLRVYNGLGTAFVEPDNLTSMADFYRYLARRERLDRDRHAARARRDVLEMEQLEREIVELDAAAPFLAHANEVFVTPSGSIVAFKHLDLRLHWVSSAPARPWIHCSPMCGERRLVVNVTSPQVARPALRRGGGATPRAE
jgi:hypothetical protein